MKILNNELSIEKENYEPNDSVLETFQASGFALHDQPTDACLELNKHLDNLQI